jgi:hypothetical protein
MARGKKKSKGGPTPPNDSKPLSPEAFADAVDKYPNPLADDWYTKGKILPEVEDPGHNPTAYPDQIGLDGQDPNWDGSPEEEERARRNKLEQIAQKLDEVIYEGLAGETIEKELADADANEDDAP